MHLKISSAKRRPYRPVGNDLTITQEYYHKCYFILPLPYSSSSIWATKVNTLRPKQSGRHFVDDPFKRIDLTETFRVSINISLEFVPNGQINNIPLVPMIAWRLATSHYMSQWLEDNRLVHASLALDKLNICYSHLLTEGWVVNTYVSEAHQWISDYKYHNCRLINICMHAIYSPHSRTHLAIHHTYPPSFHAYAVGSNGTYLLSWDTYYSGINLTSILCDDFRRRFYMWARIR